MNKSNGSSLPARSQCRVRSPAIVPAFVWLVALTLASVPSIAQQPPARPAPGPSSAPSAEAAIVDDDELRSLASETEGETAESNEAEATGVDLSSLIARGGGFMIPIGMMSFLVVALAVERLVSLRTARVFPAQFERQMRGMIEDSERFDVAEALRVCRSHPSPAAHVIRSMLLRTGQPLGDIERTAADASQREADALVGPVRWLNLAAAATPLMGLLGTVWGMIKAFHESTTLTADRSRSEQLSEGIYTALVTTLAGLAVAIPAAILAQYFENRISKLFHRIELLSFDVAPGLARFAGRSRLAADGSLQPISDGRPALPRGDATQADLDEGQAQRTTGKGQRDPAKAS